MKLNTYIDLRVKTQRLTLWNILFFIQRLKQSKKNKQTTNQPTSHKNLEYGHCIVASLADYILLCFCFRFFSLHYIFELLTNCGVSIILKYYRCLVLAVAIYK